MSVGRVPSGAENAHQFIPVPRNTSLTYDEWCEEFGRNHENRALSQVGVVPNNGYSYTYENNNHTEGGR